MQALSYQQLIMDQVEQHCTAHVVNECMGYAQVHRSVRAGSSPPRYIMVIARGGLVDNLACIGTAIDLALRTCAVLHSFPTTCPA